MLRLTLHQESTHHSRMLLRGHKLLVFFFFFATSVHSKIVVTQKHSFLMNISRFVPSRGTFIRTNYPDSEKAQLQATRWDMNPLPHEFWFARRTL